MAKKDESKAALTAAGGKALADLVREVNLDIPSVIIKNMKMSEDQNGETLLLANNWACALAALLRRES